MSPAERETPAGEAMREAVAQWLESEVGLYVSDAAEKAGEFCGPSGPIASELARLTERADRAAEVARLKKRGKTLRRAVKVARLRFEAIGDAAPEAARRLAAIGDADCAAALATTETTDA